MWMTSCTGSVRGGFWVIWKKSVELRTRLRTGRIDFRDSLRPDEFVRYGRRTWWGADGKVVRERLCISLPYVETFNPKVIKGFVPELRSRKCFSCFRIPMFCVYMLWRFYVRFTYPYLARVQKVWTPLSSQLLVKWYQYCPYKKKALALNNPRSLICHEIKKKFYGIYSVLSLDFTKLCLVWQSLRDIWLLIVPTDPNWSPIEQLHRCLTLMIEYASMMSVAVKFT